MRECCEFIFVEGDVAPTGNCGTHGDGSYSVHKLFGSYLTESLLLGLAGGLAGLFVCYLSFDFILSLVPGDLAHFGEIQLDGRVLVFSLVLGILTGVFSGLAPALQASTVDLNTALKEGKTGGGVGRKRGRLSAALVVSEVGLSLVLLVGAGLMFQTLGGINCARIPDLIRTTCLRLLLGLPHNVAFGTKEKAIAFYDNFDAKLSRCPACNRSLYQAFLPLSLGGSGHAYKCGGQ